MNGSLTHFPGTFFFVDDFIVFNYFFFILCVFSIIFYFCRGRGFGGISLFTKSEIKFIIC